MTAATLRRLRQVHLYLAVFFAPAIIFFAFSGMLQTYGFHEARGGGEPPAWIRAIASLHQHQRLHRPERPKPAPAPGAPAAARDAGPARQEGTSTAALKLFTGLMGLGLVVTSLLGIGIALGTRSTRRVSAAMLVAGLALPVVLILV